MIGGVQGLASAKSESYVFTFGLFSVLYSNRIFFCLEPLKQISLDLIALRIFFL